MLRPMFVTSSLAHGGAERHAVALVNRLSERGHECHAVYIKPAADQLARLRATGSVRCLSAERYLDARALAGFAAHISRIRPSVIVSVNPYALMYSSLASWLARLRMPQILVFHSMRLLNAKERLQMMFYRPFIWSSHCLVFVCERQRRKWLRGAVLARRREVIYNGVDTTAFRDGRSLGERVRSDLGFADSDYVIGISAVLRPEKNHVQLLDALRALRGAGIPARALLIGDGEMRAAIEARARELGVASDVVITGFQQDVRPYVAACDAMVLCSTTEAMSLAAIEAMALGKPVVHSDVGGASEMIFPGRNGFLFPVGDTASLTAKLAILADRGVARRMGSRAREAADAMFSERAMVERYERLLLQVSGARADPGRAAVSGVPDGEARARPGGDSPSGPFRSPRG